MDDNEKDHFHEKDQTFYGDLCQCLDSILHENEVTEKMMIIPSQPF